MTSHKAIARWQRVVGGLVAVLAVMVGDRKSVV